MAFPDANPTQSALVRATNTSSTSPAVGDAAQNDRRIKSSEGPSSRALSAATEPLKPAYRPAGRSGPPPPNGEAESLIWSQVVLPPISEAMQTEYERVRSLPPRFTSTRVGQGWARDAQQVDTLGSEKFLAHGIPGWVALKKYSASRAGTSTASPRSSTLQESPTSDTLPSPDEDRARAYTIANLNYIRGRTKVSDARAT